MSAASTAKEVLEAAQLLAPVVEQVADWLGGRTNEEPPVLAELPVELRSQAALMRAKARSNPPGGG